MILVKRMTTSPFRSEFESVTKPHRSIRGRLFAGQVRIELSKINSFEYRVNWLYVQPKARKHGYAGQAMEWLCELADAHNIRLSLCPLGDPEDEALTTVELTAWYQRFGFFRIGLQDEMMRYPNATRH